MNQTETNPTLMQITMDNHIDYSEMYRTQETIQLNKRLRRTRNILLICAATLLVGAAVFWSMPASTFTTNDFLVYSGFTAVMTLLSAYSSKQPYFSLLAALILCLGMWGMEVFFNKAGDLLIEGSIQKLFIISLLVSSFHSSREAEMIRNELHLS